MRGLGQVGYVVVLISTVSGERCPGTHVVRTQHKLDKSYGNFIPLPVSQNPLPVLLLSITLFYNRAVLRCTYVWGHGTPVAIRAQTAGSARRPGAVALP